MTRATMLASVIPAELPSHPRVSTVQPTATYPRSFTTIRQAANLIDIFDIGFPVAYLVEGRA